MAEGTKTPLQRVAEARAAQQRASANEQLAKLQKMVRENPGGLTAELEREIDDLRSQAESQ